MEPCRGRPTLRVLLRLLPPADEKESRLYGLTSVRNHPAAPPACLR